MGLTNEDSVITISSFTTLAFESDSIALLQLEA